jgi:hypothetical protein
MIVKGVFASKETDNTKAVTSDYLQVCLGM